ncbi:procathepsin L-like [Planococcus citri]|uniref:procathepsin L-like n=1 Tax=Planococcus citri TaxID=170843 RepID=UPI0031F87890
MYQRDRMEKLSFILLFFGLIDIQLLTANAAVDQHVLYQWNSFKIRFNKTYQSTNHEQQRMEIYLNNIEEITKHNELFEKGEVMYKKGVNQFTDLTSQEFSDRYLSKLNSFQNTRSYPMATCPIGKGTPPDHKDWVHEGAVTRVKNQGACGCCWAFSAAALLESHLYIKNKKLEDLSPQNLVDCVLGPLSKGCCGGLVEESMDYVMKGGIATEKSYPYEARRRACRYVQTENDYSRKIINYTQIPENNGECLKEVVGLIGPVSCYMDAVDFQHYESGILHRTKCSNKASDISHALVIVGYGTTRVNKTDYWLVKNSFGETWGEQGYVKVLRNKNECAVESWNFYPIL